METSDTESEVSKCWFNKIAGKPVTVQSGNVANYVYLKNQKVYHVKEQLINQNYPLYEAQKKHCEKQVEFTEGQQLEYHQGIITVFYMTKNVHLLLQVICLKRK